MQRLNYNETNGIVIGPEFSRIFAEIILQRVDKEVEKALYVNGNQECSDFGNQECSVFGNNSAVKTATMLQ